mmetsp:Transcript_9314/g.10632  ORF Transcript_9314/g.10632 Transcript_9314/m.10632 type:complete len:305 (-) Transcript_9314:20-934(-)
MKPTTLYRVIVMITYFWPSTSWSNNNNNMNSPKDRRDLLNNFVTMVSSSCLIMPELAGATYFDKKTGTQLPEEGEISSSIPRDWSDVDNIFDDDPNQLFTRLDKSPDSVFYTDPRFVEHVDENSVNTMTNFISDQVLKDGDSVLDLCSSWTSHIKASKKQSLKRIVGLGMNEKELVANKLLTDWSIKDLNLNPVLPYDDSSFSVVLCQLSIDYLTQPLQIMKEVGRILQPGGRVYILFSNRLFLQKAVALWTGKDDIDHAYTVACYLRFSNGGFKDIAAQDLSTRNKKGKVIGDPLYVVSAIKS